MIAFILRNILPQKYVMGAREWVIALSQCPCWSLFCWQLAAVFFSHTKSAPVASHQLNNSISLSQQINTSQTK